MTQATDAQIIAEINRLFPDTYVLSEQMAFDRRAKIVTHTAKLVREGWTPVDPAILFAREVFAKEREAHGFMGDARDSRNGIFDKNSYVLLAADAYRAVIADGWVKP